MDATTRRLFTGGCKEAECRDHILLLAHPQEGVHKGHTLPGRHACFIIVLTYLCCLWSCVKLKHTGVQAALFFGAGGEDWPCARHAKKSRGVEVSPWPVSLS